MGRAARVTDADAMTTSLASGPVNHNFPEVVATGDRQIVTAVVRRHRLLRALARLLSGLAAAFRVHPALWRAMARAYRPWMARFARRQAALTCRLAALEVPAYADLVARAGHRPRRYDLTTYPMTDKRGYVAAYPEVQRCWRGRIETVGTVVDESSGSSGRPYNWARSRRELRAVRRNLAGYTTLAFPARRRFVINAYSMGAWATGTTTGTAMARVAMVKNTGPDLDKIVDTLLHFGPDFDYVITAYPPFLKHLRDRLDAVGFPWARYRIGALVGGEAMTEAMRDYLEQRFTRVRSGYGASDLTIGMAGETEFTVWLRRRLRTDRALRAALLGPDEERTPMVFQYNPLETFLEVTAEGEIVCTLNGTDGLTPKLRYNVGDEGRLMPLPDVVRIVAADRSRWRQARSVWRAAQPIRLPLLFLFGRTDSTISYLGANIYPQDVEYGLYHGHDLAHVIDGFCLTLEERDDLESRPVVHVRLREATVLSDDDRWTLTDQCRRGVLDHLAATSRDFAESLREDPTAGDLRVRVHDYHDGPFAAHRDAIKNVYLTREGSA
jgi:phenylacetate-CoA ligase